MGGGRLGALLLPLHTHHTPGSFLFSSGPSILHFLPSSIQSLRAMVPQKSYEVLWQYGGSCILRRSSGHMSEFYQSILLPQIERLSCRKLRIQNNKEEQSPCGRDVMLQMCAGVPCVERSRCACVHAKAQPLSIAHLGGASFDLFAFWDLDFLLRLG